MKTYPIVETFYSLQGEGYWTGTPMFFIRLAGCSVGGKSGMCTPAFGEPFLCDTDYTCRENLTVKTLVARAVESKARHVCITGGEPFDHDLLPLLRGLADLPQIGVHIETSGTKDVPSGFYGYVPLQWVTVSPKKDCLDSFLMNHATEVKVLVSASTTLDDIAYFDQLLPALTHKYLQPVTIYHKTPIFTREVQASANVDLCISFLLHHFPTWKLSLQTHNIIGVR